MKRRLSKRYPKYYAAVKPGFLSTSYLIVDREDGIVKVKGVMASEGIQFYIDSEDEDGIADMVKRKKLRRIKFSEAVLI